MMCLILYMDLSPRPITQKQKVLKTLQIMLALLSLKAKGRARAKVKIPDINTKRFLDLHIVFRLTENAHLYR